MYRKLLEIFLMDLNSMSAHEISKKKDINRINLIKAKKRDQACFCGYIFRRTILFSFLFMFFIFFNVWFLQFIFYVLSFYDNVWNLFNKFYSFGMNKKPCFNAIKTTIIPSFTLKMWYRSKVKSLFTFAKKPINIVLGFFQRFDWFQGDSVRFYL